MLLSVSKELVTENSVLLYEEEIESETVELSKLDPNNNRAIRNKSKSIEKLKEQRKMLLEMKTSFDEVIKSDVTFHYIARFNVEEGDAQGSTYGTKSGKVIVWFNGNDRSFLVHESRHAYGFVKREWGWNKEANIPTNYDFQDEYEAYRIQSNYMNIMTTTSGPTSNEFTRHIIKHYSNKDFIIKEFIQHYEK